MTRRRDVHKVATITGEFARQCFGRIDDQWAPHADANVTSGVAVRKNVWVAELPASLDVSGMVGLRIDGRRAIRAKYPNGDPEQSGES